MRAAAVAAALLAGSCTDDTGPSRALTGYLALEPVFVSEAAGIVPVTAGRFVLRRIADDQVVKDTVLALSPAADSVDLVFSVPLQSAGETFALTIALVDAAGDTVFRGGPVTVTPSTGGAAPVAVTLPIEYTGVGFDAASVVILSPDTTLPFGAGATFTAQARDAEGGAIPGTPVQWRALDSARVSVVRQDSGRVLARTQRGPARIVARLLTGPADTIQITVQATPNSIAAESGGNQTGPAGIPYPLPLVARVLAVDDGGVDGVRVHFTVRGGGGLLSADSVLTDANGRAAVTLTPGAPGPQSVEAAVAGVSSTALFTATAVSAGPSTVMWTNPAGGTWSTGANWSTGSVPGSQDTAVITLAGTYSVTVDVDVTLQQLIVGGASGLQSLVQSANTIAVEDAAFGPNARYLLSGSGGLAGLVPGSGTVTVSGIVQWSGGTIAHDGTVVIAPGGALTVTGGTATLRTGTLRNQGVVTWLGGNVTLADGAVLQNDAAFNVLADGGLQFGGGGGGTFLNAPSGTFTKSVTAGNTSLIVPATNHGQMNITTGSLVFGNNLSFTHAGTFTGGPGTVLSFGGTGIHVLDSTVTGFGRVETSNVDLTLNGTVAVSHLSVGAFGDITVNAPLVGVDSVTVQRGLILTGGGPHTVPYLRLAGGTISGDEALGISDSLIWSGGALLGTGQVTLNAGAIARLTTTAAKSVVGPLRFDGSVFWTGGVLAMDGDGVLNVGTGGLLDMQGDLTAQFGTGGAVIDVAGTFRKSSGAGTGTVNPALVVSGILDVGSGTLDLNGDFTLAAEGTIHGDGVLDVASVPTVTLGGTVSPGNSPAQLVWVGPYAPGAGSVLEIELGGVVVGAGYDQLSVNGAATPAGTLNVSLINGFTPVTGQQFTILSALSTTGDFATVNLPPLPPPLTWQRTATGNFVVLTVTTPSLGMAFLSDVGSDVHFVDLNADTTATPVACSLAQCFEPRNLDIDRAGTLVAVPFRFSDMVSLLDPATGEFVDNVQHASFNEPYAAAFTPDGAEIWVANKFGGGSDTGTVSVIDVASRAVVAVIEDGSFSSPEGLVVAAGRAWVPNRGGNSVTIVDLATRTVIDTVVLPATPSNEPRYAVATPDGAFVYVSTNFARVFKIDTGTLQAVSIALPGGGSRNMAVHPLGTKVYVAQQSGSIAVVDVATDGVTSIAFTNASSTYGVAILLDGTLGLVTDESLGVVHAFDPVIDREIIGPRFPITRLNTPRAIVAH